MMKKHYNNNKIMLLLLIIIVNSKNSFSSLLINNNNVRVYFGENINLEETCFDYYEINFRAIDKNISNFFPDLWRNFNDIFFLYPNSTKISYPRQTPQFYTQYRVSIQDIPRFSIEIKNDTDIHQVKSLLEHYKYEISSFFDKKGLLQQLPMYYKLINNAKMPWPLYINNIQLRNFSMHFQLFRHYPLLLDLLLPLPLINPPPLNSIFTLYQLKKYSFFNNNSFYLAFLNYKKSISLSTLIPIQNITINKNKEKLYVFPFPQKTIIKIENNNNNFSKKDIFILHAKLHTYLLKKEKEKINCSYFEEKNKDFIFYNKNINNNNYELKQENISNEKWSGEKCNFEWSDGKNIKISFYNAIINRLLPPPPSSSTECSQLIIPINIIIIILIIIFVILLVFVIYGCYLNYCCNKNDTFFSYYKTEPRDNAGGDYCSGDKVDDDVFGI